MALSSTFRAENESGSHSPTESFSSAVSADSEIAIRNIGRKSLAQEIEDYLKRENNNRDEDAQKITEGSLGHAILTWFFGGQVEDLLSEITNGEILKILERIHEETNKHDAPGLPVPTTTTILVVMIICCSLVLIIALTY